MSRLSILAGRTKRDLLITCPSCMEGHLKLTLPEFYGRIERGPFAVDQVLTWDTADQNGSAEFTLDAPASEVGIDCHGTLATRHDQELDLETYVANVLEEPIEEAHHTIHLDLSTTSRFHDPEGARTFVYTNTGWVSLQALHAGQEAPPPSIWVGATYGEHTVIWRVMARTAADGDLTIALAADRGYALASDHPEWPKGLMVGCRWGTLPVHEESLFRGTVYFCDHGLEELRQRYARDFRPS